MAHQDDDEAGLPKSPTVPCSARLVRALMRVGAADGSWPFSPEDVILLHLRKRGRRGLWFRLRDGRVFDSKGRPSEPDPAFYTTIH